MYENKLNKSSEYKWAIGKMQKGRQGEKVRQDKIRDVAIRFPLSQLYVNKKVPEERNMGKEIWCLRGSTMVLLELYVD